MLMEAHRSVGRQTKIVHPIHMNKVFKMLDDYKFPIIKRFLEVVDQKKYSYGIIDA